MKVPRSAIGKMVEFTWRDPYTGRHSARTAPEGMGALATWTERGVIDNITEGVVRVIHERVQNPPITDVIEEEVVASWVPEDLIDSLTLYEPLGGATEPRKP